MRIYFDLDLLKINKKVINEIMVHYLGWNCVYDEIIDVSSQRIAKKGFYTSRNNIPRYYHAHGLVDSMQSYVVIGDQIPIISQHIEMLPDVDLI